MFKFELQPVLDFRRSVEERILMAFAERARQLEIEKEKLAGLRQKKSSLVHRFGVMQKRAMKADEVASLVSFLERVRKEERAQEQRVRDAAAELDERREELLEAVKKRKVLDVLKERQEEDYRRTLTRKERSRLDEFGIDRYQREEGQENYRRL